MLGIDAIGYHNGGAFVGRSLSIPTQDAWVAGWGESEVAEGKESGRGRAGFPDSHHYEQSTPQPCVSDHSSTRHFYPLIRFHPPVVHMFTFPESPHATFGLQGQPIAHSRGA